VSGHIELLRWKGAVPTGANTIVLYSTLDRTPNAANWEITGQVSQRKPRLVLTVFHDQAGKVELHAKQVRSGGTLRKVRDTGSLAATGTADQIVFYVAHLPEFELRWVNGGVDQVAFLPFLCFDAEAVGDV